MASQAEVDQVVNAMIEVITRVVGPIGANAKDVRQQSTGGRDAGEFPGWPQLGGRTVVDALAVIGEHLKIEGFGKGETPG